LVHTNAAGDVDHDAPFVSGVITQRDGAERRRIAARPERYGRTGRRTAGEVDPRGNTMATPSSV